MNRYVGNAKADHANAYPLYINGFYSLTFKLNIFLLPEYIRFYDMKNGSEKNDFQPGNKVILEEVAMPAH